MRSLKLTAIFDEEKGPIQCRYVKVTRSRRVLKSMRRTNNMQGLTLTVSLMQKKALFNVDLSRSPGHNLCS